VEKLIYALWREVDSEPLDVAAAVAGAAGVHALAAYTEEPAAAAMRWGDDARGLVLTGLVTAWVDRVEDRASLEPALAATGLTIGGYVVAESAPCEGDPVSLGLVTLFRRKPGLTDDELFAIWHGSHTPLTFEIHPFNLYLRNLVARVLTPGAPRFEAIVEEGVADDRDLLELGRLYGAGDDADLLRRNIEHISGDAKRFIDFTSLQTCPMRRTVLIPAPWQQPGGG
jgi:hypothetical protein